MFRCIRGLVPRKITGSLSAAFSLSLFIPNSVSFSAKTVEQKLFISSGSGTEDSGKRHSNPTVSHAWKNAPQTPREVEVDVEDSVECATEEDESVMQELLPEVDSTLLLEEEFVLPSLEDKEDLAACRDARAVTEEEMYASEEETLSLASPNVHSTPSEIKEPFKSSTPSAAPTSSESKVCDPESADTKIQSPLSSQKLQIPKMVYRPRLFIYDSVYNSNHPKEAGKQKRIARKKAVGESLGTGKSRMLVSPVRFQELCQWCHNILPAVPTDDIAEIQITASSTNLPLVSNIYLVENPKSLWKAYEKKFMKHVKTRSEADMESFQTYFAQYDLSAIVEPFSDIKNVKSDILHLTKRMRDDFILFTKNKKAIERGRERLSTLPVNFLPLTSYPLIIVVCSPLEDSREAEQLQEQIRTAISRSRLIPNYLISSVASELHVCVLRLEETAKLRDALAEGDVGFAWPDHSFFMKALKDEKSSLSGSKEQKLPTYKEWKEPVVRSFFEHPEVVVSEKDVAKALKLIRKRKEAALTSSNPPPPEELFPLKAKVFSNARTARLSDQIGLVLPPTSHLFVVDVKDQWKGSSGEVDRLVDQALQWHGVDGTPLIFNTSLYEVECCTRSKSEKKVNPFTAKQTPPFPSSGENEPIQSSTPKDAVLNKLLSHLQPGWKFASLSRTPNQKGVEKATNLNISDRKFPTENVSENFTAPSNDVPTSESDISTSTKWKNASLVPLLFVFQTSLSPEKAFEVQQVINRCFLRSGVRGSDRVCVLGKQFSTDEELVLQSSPTIDSTDAVDSTVIKAWEAADTRNHFFPVKELKKKECDVESLAVPLIQTRTLVDPLSSEVCSGGNRDLCESGACTKLDAFLAPYVLSLLPGPVSQKHPVIVAKESEKTFKNEKDSFDEAH